MFSVSGENDVPMVDSDKESLAEHIKRLLDQARAEVARYERMYEAAGGTVDNKRKRYLGMRTWRAVYEFLSTAPGLQASLTEVLEELKAAAVPLGTYPKRTVSSAVNSPSVADLFETTRVGNDDVIRLKRLLLPDEKRRQRRYPEPNG
jgi:hypothetical protein